METLSFVEAAVDETWRRIARGEQRLAVDAPRGADLSHLIRRLGDTLPAGKRLVRVELPEGDDGGMVALASAAAQLGVLPPGEPAIERHAGGDLAAHGPKARWKVVLKEVSESLRQRAGEVLLLVDRPRFDRSSAPQSELFVQQAGEVTDLLLGIPGAITLLTRAPSAPGFGPVALEVPSLREVAATFPEPLATQLRNAPKIRRASPFVPQALAALVAIGDSGHRLSGDLREERLLDELSRTVAGEDALRRVIARLCTLRVPFPATLLDVADQATLSDRGRRFVGALLVRSSDGLVALPEALRRRVQVQRKQGDPLWLGDETADAHRFAADYHRTAFATARDAKDVVGAVRHEMELIHHLTEAGDAAAVLERSVWFVEQYDALGKTLSQMALRFSHVGRRDVEERLRREAISAYERALAHDEEDAYAHHYVGYNLDILATDPARAEVEYQRARALRSDHGWYHGRYICFLITRGRMTDARGAYRAALEAMDEPPAEEEGARVYEELHGEIARLLLHAGELQFAREVLDNVPAQIRSVSGGIWSALEHLLAILTESRDERLVFPPRLAVEIRWEGPHLVPDPSHVHIASWMPGCVVGSDQKLHVRIARRDGEGRVIVSYVHLTRKQLSEMVPPGFPRMPPAGTFVEIVRYRDGTETLLTHGRAWSGVQIPNLPLLFPRPDRYIRRAFADA
jgi:tetratricopeptide (TPR) repeat protein